MVEKLRSYKGYLKVPLGKAEYGARVTPKMCRNSKLPCWFTHFFTY